uniref:Glycerate kinase n=1 Tax=Macrostomum lignano TaxID=282301 RepID=A0A1I8GFF3_9PLAT
LSDPILLQLTAAAAVLRISGLSRMSAAAASTVGSRLCDAFAAGVAAVDPESLVRRSIELLSDVQDGEVLRLRIRSSAGECRDFDVAGGVGFVAFGKAAGGMACGLPLARLGRRFLGGVVLAPAPTRAERSAGLGFRLPDDSGLASRIRVFEGPRDNLPDETVLMGSRAVSDLIDSLGPGDLLVAMVTGGGSALLAWPRLPLPDYRAATRALSTAGFSIAELNAVRARLDAVKAGGLALRCRARGCQLAGLVLSDVVGDPLEVIASGPTVPVAPAAAGAALQAALETARLRGVDARLPPTALKLLQADEAAAPAPVAAPAVANFIVGNNRTALEAARLRLLDAAVVMTTELAGDVSAVAERVHAWLASLLRLMLRADAADTADTADFPSLGEGDAAKLAEAVAIWRAAGGSGGIALLAGGEPTVDTTGALNGVIGVGGRAGHLALLLAERLGRWPAETVQGRPWRPTVLTAGTDGIDGPTEAAGGLVDSDTWPRAAARLGEGRCRAALAGFDSHSLLAEAGGEPPALFQPGLTGTNVMDLVIAALHD